uniref:Uncharacterized protein n=1 Tax=Trichobilharzia regenti TaxID=157069 RepID=A0AA85ISI2_TRIRE|nr:unnamed protein product [Trichobilharzia regenti]
MRDLKKRQLYVCKWRFLPSEKSQFQDSMSKTVIDLLDREHKGPLLDTVKLAKHQNDIDMINRRKSDRKSTSQLNSSLSKSPDNNLRSPTNLVKPKIEVEDSIEPEMFTENPSLREETYAFCEFIANLDGLKSYNPEPTTLASLFAGTHEAQPPVSTPINVVDLLNLPEDLRNSVEEPPNLFNEKHSINDSKCLPRIMKSNAARRQEEHFERLRYGAWYIPPKQWKVTKCDNDKNASKEKITSNLENTKIKTHKELVNSLNQRMKETHGYNAFMEFIEIKNERLPEFMKISTN